jgi:hypothetical protein
LKVDLFQGLVVTAKGTGMATSKPIHSPTSGNTSLQQNSKEHKICLKRAELQCWKDKVFFLYELILLSGLVGFCIFTIIAGFSWPSTVAAAGILSFIAKKIIQHMTDTI